MGIFDKFFGKSDKMTFGDEHEKCLVKIKLTKSEMSLWSFYYYKGHTSYRSIFKYVYFNNLSKLTKVMKLATKKAENGCNIDITYVRFYYDNKLFIDIPFDVFSEKKNMRISRRNTKIWNKANLKRILQTYPEYIELEDSLLKEFLENQILNILEENN